jgi:diguanylate cyclase (GGDEF)-like protein/PAS domain S-box-containing protein
LIVPPYVALLLMSVVLAMTLAYLAHEQRVPGAGAFTLIIVDSVFRELARVEVVLTTSTASKLLYAQLAAVGSTLMPVLWFLFALAYSAPGFRIRRGILVLLWVIPVITIALILTNDWHHLVWQSITRSSPASDAYMVVVRGPWFLVAAAYGYTLLFSGIIMLIRAFTRYPAYYRGQVIVMVIAVLCYGVSSAVYQLGIVPTSDSVLVSLGYATAEAIWFWGILRFRIFNLLPVARDVVVDSMHDGVIVLDTMRRIVDINRAALTMLGVSPISPIGRKMSDVWEDWPDLEEVATPADRTSTREIRARTDTTSYFEVRTVPLIPRRNQASGVLVLLRDISDRRRAEAALQAANARLEAQLAENLNLQERLREEAIRDPVTFLYNRRFLQETLFRELAHANREGLPLAVVMIDVDHFKRLNDQHGHQAGDLVLQALAEQLLNTTRGEDVVCRYGGEEFVVVLPGAGLADAMRRARGWRADFAQLQVPCADLHLTATFSAGVADYPAAGHNGDDLIRAADQALYIAKRAGRNRVVAWSATEPPEARAAPEVREVVAS